MSELSTADTHSIRQHPLTVIGQSVADTEWSRIQRLHDSALDLSIAYDVPVEVPERAVSPRHIGADAAGSLAIRRVIGGRQLARNKAGSLMITRIMSVEEARQFRGEEAQAQVPQVTAAV